MQAVVAAEINDTTVSGSRANIEYIVATISYDELRPKLLLDGLLIENNTFKSPSFTFFLESNVRMESLIIRNVTMKNNCKTFSIHSIDFASSTPLFHITEVLQFSAEQIFLKNNYFSSARSINKVLFYLDPIPEA